MLADGTQAYLYSNGRITQQSVTSTAYFLGDALGSVRQAADGGGRLALARWYDPYGNLASNRGDAATVYGFTGEWGTTLLDLRARWYAPAYGRFNSKDVWPSSYIKLTPASGGYGPDTSRFASLQREVELQVTVSGGLSAFPLDGRTENEIIRKADQALYRAKATGRNRVCLAQEERMVTKTTHYPQTQLERLAKLAQKEGVGEAALLREALDDLLIKYGVSEVQS